MSLDAQDWVWEHSRSKGTARLVILAIADKASGPDCSAYAGTAFLTKRANASRRAVVMAVDWLLSAGEVEVIEGRWGPRGETYYRLPKAAGHRRGGADSAPVQNLHRGEGGAKSAPVQYVHRGGADSASGGVQKMHRGGAENAPLNAVNTERTQENAKGEGAPPRETTPPTPAEAPLASLATPSPLTPDASPINREALAAELADELSIRTGLSITSGHCAHALDALVADMPDRGNPGLWLRGQIRESGDLRRYLTPDMAAAYAARLGRPTVVAAAPEPQRKPVKVPLPDGWTPTDALLRWATRDHPDVNATYETAQFVSHHRARGTECVSWPDEWQKWIRRAQTFARPAPARAASHGGHQPYRNPVDQSVYYEDL